MNPVLTSLKRLTDRLFAPILEKPERGLWLLMALQFIAWAVIPYLYNWDVPDDILFHSIHIRNLSDSGDMFSSIHSPLPMLITHWLNFGQGFLYFPHLALAQIFVCVTFYLVYLLGVQLFQNKKQALAAAFILLLLKDIYGEFSVQFNHELALYPFWIGLILIFYHATKPLAQKANQQFYWLLFGVVAGVATYMKLTIGILLLVMMFWMVMDKNARAHLTTKSPYMGASIALILIGLHFYLAFFDEMGNLRLNYLHRLNVGPNYDFLRTLYELQEYVAILVSVAGVIFVANFVIHQSPLHAPLQPNARSFILFFAFAPLILALIMTVVFQQFTHHWWFNSMFSLLGVAFVALIYQRWHDGILKVILVVCTCFILHTPILSYAVGIKKAGNYSHDYVSAVAQKMETLWQENYTTPQPYIILYGFDTTLQAAVLLTSRHPMPHISKFWDELDAILSHQVIQQHGGLLIYREERISWIKTTLANAHDQKIFDELNKQAHIFTFENSHDRNNPRRVGFVIIPPAQ